MYYVLPFVSWCLMCSSTPTPRKRLCLFPYLLVLCLHMRCSHVFKQKYRILAQTAPKNRRILCEDYKRALGMLCPPRHLSTNLRTYEHQTTLFFQRSLTCTYVHTSVWREDPTSSSKEKKFGKRHYLYVYFFTLFAHERGGLALSTLAKSRNLSLSPL